MERIRRGEGRQTEEPFALCLVSILQEVRTQLGGEGLLSPDRRPLPSFPWVGKKQISEEVRGGAGEGVQSFWASFS